MRSINFSSLSVLVPPLFINVLTYQVVSIFFKRKINLSNRVVQLFEKRAIVNKKG